MAHSFMHYDPGYIDLEQRTLQTIDNPFEVVTWPSGWQSRSRSSPKNGERRIDVIEFLDICEAIGVSATEVLATV